MKLVSFSVQKYRSITRAHKLPIKSKTILVGPNNEGKSNILKALVTVLTIVRDLGRFGIYKGRLKRSTSGLSLYDYDWIRDFPVSLQELEPQGESIFELEFELTEGDIKGFRSEISSNISGTLPIRITLGQNSPGFKVIKRGPGATVLTKKAELIARYISKRIDFQYIPAIRTAESAQEIVNGMMTRALADVEENEEYKKAISAITKIQEPILKELGVLIMGALKDFIPGVRDVMVSIPSDSRRIAMRRSCVITVDDGNATSLQDKGDGVQSLAALSLMRHKSVVGAMGRQLILAIEEPESHLHPTGIRQFKKVLDEITEPQIILSSHNPLFVERQDISSNIIVKTSNATPAKNINEIREILGVHASDNLRNADLILIVEGECDKVALEALLPMSSEKLSVAFNTNRIVIDTLAGGNNLSYKLSQLRNGMYKSYVFIDYDAVARDAAQKAIDEGLITGADVTYARCVGLREAEVEDMYDPNLYKDIIHKYYGVELPRRTDHSKKWSDRIKSIFEQDGKAWDSKIEKEVKIRTAQKVAEKPSDALHPNKRSSFDALVKALEERLIPSLK